jgi:xeroderma pigmentosum group C-complementing protein
MKVTRLLLHSQDAGRNWRMGKNAAAAVPKGWPDGPIFLTRSTHSASLSASQIAELRNRPPAAGEVLDELPLNLAYGPCCLVQIKPITDPLHPAYGQYGLFAAKDLKPGSLIIPYLGELHPGTGSGSKAAEESDYDLWLCRSADVAIDAARAGNEARFINDYRGVPGRKVQGPNVEFREVWDGRGGPGKGQRGIAAFVKPATKKQLADSKAGDVGIAKGKEILVSYGKGFWNGRRNHDEE